MIDNKYKEEAKDAYKTVGIKSTNKYMKEPRRRSFKRNLNKNNDF